ncbi:MAG: Uma2 family endonuclease, partial [Chloroflexota bacterium]
VTAEAFEQFIHEPQNADKRFELINGQIVEATSSHYASVVGAYLGAMVSQFVREYNIGRVTGANGGFQVGGNSVLPSFAVTSYDKCPKPLNVAYVPFAPFIQT